MNRMLDQGPTSPPPGDRPHIDPLAQTIAKWRWQPVEPLDEPTARKIGGAYFQYLFDGKTSYAPVGTDEEVYFGYLRKKFATVAENESRTMPITAEEIATVLKLAQGATLTKAAISRTSIHTTDIASDDLLEEIYMLLEQNATNTAFIEEIDKRLNASKNIS